MSNDAKAFVLVLLLLFGMNFCTGRRIDGHNENLKLEYHENSN